MGDIILRLVIWFLLTANFSIINIIIGVTIALVLPRSFVSPTRLKDLMWSLGKIIVAFPQAYGEAIQMMLQPHTEEEIVMQKVQGDRSSWLIFLEIFLITFTPKSTVMKYHEDGWFEVHYVKRRSQK
jgi:multicomponent Na+:H+ antiporter subunit E